MKKVYLFCAALIGFSSVQAQETVQFLPHSLNHDYVDLHNYSGPQAQPSKVRSQRLKTVTETIALGSAGNIYSSILNGPNQVSYNSALNSIVFIHRENGTTGNLRYDISTDGGVSWEVDMGPLTPAFDAGDAPQVGGGNRYPNMTIWNPEGNTDLSQAYMVGSGPALSDQTTTWGNIFQVSAALDGSNISENYADVTGTLEAFHPYGMTSANGAVWTLSTTYNTDVVDLERDTISYANFYLNKGVFNADNNNFDWSVQEIFTADWVRYDINGNGFDDNFVSTWNLAFSPDGMTGYAVILGNEVSAIELDSLPRPVIWKSIDGGDSWNRLPEYDFSGEQAFIDNLVYNEETQIQIEPYFSAMDITVDGNGRLHMVTHVLSGAVDLGFVYTDLTTQHIFHCSTSDGTDWSVNYLAPKLNNEDGTVGTISLDERLQIARTENGSHIFFTWQEDDDGLEIIFPDVMAIGYEVESQSYSNPKNLTVGTDSEEYAFWQALAPTVISGGECFDFELPIVIAEPFGGELDPLQYYFLRGAGFDQSEINSVVSVSENSASNAIRLYPNPSSGSVFIAGLKGLTSIVNVYDMQGRYVQDFALVGGNNNLDLSSLNSGIYMLEIQSGGKLSTQKLVIE